MLEAVLWAVIIVAGVAGMGFVLITILILIYDLGLGLIGGNKQ